MMASRFCSISSDVTPSQLTIVPPLTVKAKLDDHYLPRTLFPSRSKYTLSLMYPLSFRISYFASFQ